MRRTLRDLTLWNVHCEENASQLAVILHQLRCLTALALEAASAFLARALSALVETLPNMTGLEQLKLLGFADDAVQPSCAPMEHKLFAALALCPELRVLEVSKHSNSVTRPKVVHLHPMKALVRLSLRGILPCGYQNAGWDDLTPALTSLEMGRALTSVDQVNNCLIRRLTPLQGLRRLALAMTITRTSQVDPMTALSKLRGLTQIQDLSLTGCAFIARLPVQIGQVGNEPVFGKLVTHHMMDFRLHLPTNLTALRIGGLGSQISGHGHEGPLLVAVGELAQLCTLDLGGTALPLFEANMGALPQGLTALTLPEFATHNPAGFGTALAQRVTGLHELGMCDQQQRSWLRTTVPLALSGLTSLAALTRLTLHARGGTTLLCGTLATDVVLHARLSRFPALRRIEAAPGYLPVTRYDVEHVPACLRSVFERPVDDGNSAANSGACVAFVMWYC
jgi:hypothetical protein